MQDGRNNAHRLQQCVALWHALIMTHSTITEKFQTTIPLEVRVALKLKPRQRLSYEVRSDGSAIVRPAPGVSDLFGSIKIKRPVAGPDEEKHAARAAIAREGVTEGQP